MRLTFAVACILAVLIAGTTTICLSGVVNARTVGYGTARAVTGDWFNLDQTAHRLYR